MTTHSVGIGGGAVSYGLQRARRRVQLGLVGGPERGGGRAGRRRRRVRRRRHAACTHTHRITRYLTDKLPRLRSILFTITKTKKLVKTPQLAEVSVDKSTRIYISRCKDSRTKERVDFGFRFYETCVMTPHFEIQIR